MQDRDLIVGVLATQAGFATPAQVLSAAEAGLGDARPDSLLTRLEQTGALDGERRRIIETLVEQAVQARNGDLHAVVTSLGGAAALFETLSSSGAARPPAEVSGSAAPEVPLERPGQYTRLQELGRGGQSVVRAARDRIVGREVALKELSPVAGAAADSGSSRAARARFLREVRLIASLDHPGIVAIHELARREDGTLFCAEKLIRGETLKTRIARCGSLDERLRLLRHVVDACQAVAYAHAKRIVHRDLKPSNVMVGEYGETVVVDWGLAKHLEEAEEVVPLPESAEISEPALSVAGTALGTPAYMSPEQARGDIAAVDARSDVFSLGAILYQVLTGRPPFEGATAEQVMENVRAGKSATVLSVSPEAPPELAAIVERALRSNPAERYQDAAGLSQELSIFLAGGRVRAYRYGAWELLGKFVSTHRALTTGLAVAMGALLVSGVVVALRLHAARVALASSFVERAYAAEGEGDWARAASYFAAAREQHDTPESRWGVSLAGARATERSLSLHGPEESFIDVGVLPDGRIVALGLSSNRVEVRDVEGGNALWTHASDRIFFAALLPGGLVRLSIPGGWAFFDAARGNQLAMAEREKGRPCVGPLATPVRVLRGQLLAGPGSGPSRTLATDVSGGERCVVSDDGRQVAYQDSSEAVQLLSLEDGHRLARRSAAGLRSMLFSRHGLVISKIGRLDVVGGPEGDFTIELPEAGFGEFVVRLGGDAVSADGHLVAVARLGSNRADVVDLRSRSIRGTLHYGPGWPRFAFSLDGQRVFAAGLSQGAQLQGWRLPPDESPTTHPGNWWYWTTTFTRSGSRLMVVDGAKHQFEIHGLEGELLERGGVPDSLLGIDFAQDGTGKIIIVASEGNDVYFQDPGRGRVRWSHSCRFCAAYGLSADGTRLAKVGGDGLQVWDLRADRLLFAETERVAAFQTNLDLSADGRHVAWTRGPAAILRDLESGQERTLSLESAARGMSFSPDSARIVIATTAMFTLWETATGRLIWSVANAIPDALVAPSPRWSADGKALLLRYETLGAVVLDAARGDRLARFPAARSVSPAVVFLQPDLRAKILMTDTHWDRRPLPQPATEPPAVSLARTLARTGLSLQGGDLVAAP